MMAEQMAVWMVAMMVALLECRMAASKVDKMAAMRVVW